MNEPLTDGYLELVQSIGYARPTRTSGGYWLPETEAEIDLTRQAEALDAARISLLAEVDRLRARVAELEAQAENVAAYCAQRAEYVTSLRQFVEGGEDDYFRWTGHAEARRQLSQLLGLPVAWPAEDAQDSHEEKVAAYLATPYTDDTAPVENSTTPQYPEALYDPEADTLFRCTHCKGDCADPEDLGDYDSAVHMHNPGTRGPCPECNGTGRQPTS